MLEWLEHLLMLSEAADLFTTSDEPAALSKRPHGNPPPLDRQLRYRRHRLATYQGAIIRSDCPRRRAPGLGTDPDRAESRHPAGRARRPRCHRWWTCRMDEAQRHTPLGRTPHRAAGRTIEHATASPTTPCTNRGGVRRGGGCARA